MSFVPCYHCILQAHNQRKQFRCDWMFCLILVLFNFCGLRLSHFLLSWWIILLDHKSYIQLRMMHTVNLEAAGLRSRVATTWTWGSWVGTDHGIFHEEASGRRTGDSPTFLRARACSWCRTWWRCVFRCAWFSRILFLCMESLLVAFSSSSFRTMVQSCSDIWESH
jgi:hypothetical protein